LHHAAGLGVALRYDARVDSAPEEWDVLDWTGTPTGRTVSRATGDGDPASALAPGEAHRVVLVCLFRPAPAGPEMLIQRRTDTKIGWPGAWDITAGGSVLAGETSQDGAARELLEEVGVAVDLSRTGPAVTVRAPKSVYDIYLMNAPADLDITTLSLQPEEVAAVRWASRDDIQDMITDGRFVAYKPSLVDHLFAQYGRPGLQTRSYFPGPDE